MPELKNKNQEVADAVAKFNRNLERKLWRRRIQQSVGEIDWQESKQK